MYVHYGLSWHVQRGEIIATLACCELRKGTPLRLARKSSGLNRSISASTEHKLFHSNTVRCLCKSGRETNHAPICQHMFHSRWADSMPVTRDMQSECQRTKSLVVIGGCNCHVPMTCFSSLDLFYGLIVLYSIESIAPQFCTRKNVWFDVDDVDSFQSSQLCILDNHGAKSIFPILHSLTGGIFLWVMSCNENRKS
jgi:hypothetical protein